MNPRKLEDGFRRISTRIPVAFTLRTFGESCSNFLASTISTRYHLETASSDIICYLNAENRKPESLLLLRAMARGMSRRKHSILRNGLGLPVDSWIGMFCLP